MNITKEQKRNKPHTIPEVFIIESLKQSDEKANLFDGLLLYKMLKLAGKNPRYIYFEKAEELPHLMKIFDLSQYRYLHISCHGTITDVFTKHDMVAYSDFSTYLKDSLKTRRLFLSACELGNESFVTALSKNNRGMQSVMAPVKKIEFGYAATFWNSFYFSMFKEDENMKIDKIKGLITKLANLYSTDIFFASYHPEVNNMHKKINFEWECNTIKG